MEIIKLIREMIEGKLGSRWKASLMLLWAKRSFI